MDLGPWLFEGLRPEQHVPGRYGEPGAHMTKTSTPAAPGATGGGTTEGASTVPGLMRRSDDERVHWVASIPFFLVHLSPLLLLLTGVSREAVLLLLATFWGRMFFITGGYHRYFSHRSYRLARVPQFLMAFGGTTAAQKGPLWWAAHHRHHHRNADTEDDVHSPQKGFWWSHVGWILCDRNAATRTERVPDLARYPELRFLDRFDWIGPWVLGVACFLLAGWQGLVLGFFVSTVLLWHATFLINSLAHVVGRRRYVTTDTSRNSLALAVLTLGEGWHNNHHYVARSARNGFFWWEWDPTYYVLRALGWVGIVRDLNTPTEAQLAANRVDDGNFDIGTFRANWTARRRVRVAGVNGQVGDYLRHTRTRAGEVVEGTRHTLTDDIDQRRRALEELVESSRHSADELAARMRRHQRELSRGGS
ncbi:MAG: acyl-CoA desaturase [Acidimicrobiia bacterium]|nr:acyl-CoA desaturase [Acidimicrobiia bacterium]